MPPTMPVNWMTIRINNADYTLTDQRYDWITRSLGHKAPNGEWITDWDQVIKFIEQHEHKRRDVIDEII